MNVVTHYFIKINHLSANEKTFLYEVVKFNFQILFGLVLKHVIWVFFIYLRIILHFTVSTFTYFCFVKK